MKINTEKPENKYIMHINTSITVVLLKISSLICGRLLLTEGKISSPRWKKIHLLPSPLHPPAGWEGEVTVCLDETTKFILETRQD